MNRSLDKNQHFRQKMLQIISSLLKMNRQNIQKQLNKYHRRISQLVGTQIIQQFQSVNTTKLLVYQLVLYIAQSNQKVSKSLLPKPSKKLSSKNQKMVQNQSHQQQAIRQLEQIIKKKQRRIKQLNSQLSQTLNDQKQLQDINEQLQKNVKKLKKQVKNLNQELDQYKNQNKEQQNINEFKLKLMESYEPITTKKQRKGQKFFTQTPNTTFIDSFSDRYFTDSRNFYSKNNSQIIDTPRKQNDIEDKKLSQSLYRMLLIQSNSIQAMI